MHSICKIFININSSQINRTYTLYEKKTIISQRGRILVNLRLCHINRKTLPSTVSTYLSLASELQL